MKRIVIFLLTIFLPLFAGCATNPPSDAAGTGSQEEEIVLMYISVNDTKLEVALANNSSVDALVEILQQGDLTFTASENGGFEIYGSLGRSLPTNNTQITAEAGDVLLYAGKYLCLFYDSNTYSYTRIGKINGYTMSELRTIFSTENGSVPVTIGLK